MFSSWYLNFPAIGLIRFADVVDILVVSFVVYTAAKWIRDTRAEQLIKGIVILLVAAQVFFWLQLNTINFILQNAVQTGILALLVVFQPELRRALEHMGRSKFGNFLQVNGHVTEEELVVSIDKIVQAVAEMAQQKIGALLVLERKTHIGDIIRSGTTVDALISSELIMNIFMPNSPLHDGALVVRENRLIAAGCFLPLTQNEDLSQELGTRHRAAIGLSESVDAIVVVVSEETGKISIALNGDLTRNLNPDTLKRALHKSLIQPKEEVRKNPILWKVKKK